MEKKKVTDLPVAGGILTDAASILAIQDVSIKRIYVPAWDMSVYLRTPTALAKGHFEASVAAENRDIDTLKLRLCAMTVCDAQGNLLFKNDKEAINGLGGNPGVVPTCRLFFKLVQLHSGAAGQ